MKSSPIHLRVFRIAAAVAALGGAAPLPAQVATTGVRLELRPRLGDTVKMRIDQHTELTGTLSRSSRDTSIRLRTSMLMFTRAIVERADETGVLVMAVTDSVRLESTPRNGSDFEAMARSITGKRVYMRVLPDGSSELIRADAALSSVVRGVLADMPATLPARAVTVGSSWQRVVHIPIEGGMAPNSVSTTFTLDSLSDQQRIAYISMRGVIVESVAREQDSEGASASGNLRGHVVLDREKGRILESVAEIRINAEVRRPQQAGVLPMNLQIRITQQMRTLNKR